jgi:hypothetical protein
MPCKYSDYHPEWKVISRSIIFDRAKNRCELCDAENGQPHWKTGSKVVLTVHHIRESLGKKNIDPLNLIALCQRCHLRLDLHKHVRKNVNILND